MKNLNVRIKDMNRTSIIFSILFILLGLFLLIKPDSAIHLVSYALGIMLLIGGSISMIKFFSNKQLESYLDLNFVVGSFVFIFGIIILIKPTTIASIIPLLLGIWMVINGVTKLSYSLTLNKNNKSLSSILVALLILVCGILLIFNPFEGAKFFTQILGATIIIYSVLDLIECIVIKKSLYGYAIEENNIIDAEFTEKK